MTNTEKLQAILPKIKAVIFDMDGVLVDSEEQHFKSHKRALGAFGVSLNKRLYKFHGVSRDPVEFYTKAIGRKVLNENLLSLIMQRKNNIFQLLQKQKGVHGGEEAISLARWLASRKTPIAVATNMDSDNANRQLKALGIHQLFKHVVSAENMNKKPAPDVYQKTAQLLGVAPGECLAIEDSGSGVQSAVSAGMRCIAVPSELTKLHDFSTAVAISSCDEVLNIWKDSAI